MKMKEIVTAESLVKQLITPIVETLASENGHRIVLDRPIFHESISGNLFEKFNTDQIQICYLLENGFITVQDMEEVGEEDFEWEDVTSPYGELPLNVLAEIINVVQSSVGFRRPFFIIEE